MLDEGTWICINEHDVPECCGITVMSLFICYLVQDLLSMWLACNVALIYIFSVYITKLESKT